MFLQPENLSPAAFREINWWYIYQARDKQCPPDGDWFGWLIRSGRGFGKTRTGAEWVIDRARQGYKRIALIGQTVADVRDVMIETEDCSILNISPAWFMPEYEPTKRRLTWPNGALASTYSGDKPDQLRGPQHDTVWIDELAKFKYPKLTWDNMELGLRIGDNPQVCITTTPRPIPIIKELLDDEAVEDVQGSTYENIANLADRFRQRVLARYEGTHLGKQELYGEVLEDNPRALWKRKDIEDYRLTKAPELVRIVIGVDPTGGVADCGIVAAGRGRGKHAFVLDDESLLESPGEWAKAAVTLYHKLKADRIVGEANYGGARW
jgi:phage terminase large subunit-like protein